MIWNIVLFASVLMMGVNWALVMRRWDRTHKRYMYAVKILGDIHPLLAMEVLRYDGRGDHPDGPEIHSAIQPPLNPDGGKPPIFH